MSKKENHPLGFKFPRRVKVISKRLNMETNELLDYLSLHGYPDVFGTTYLNDNQLLSIKKLIIEKRKKNFSFKRLLNKRKYKAGDKAKALKMKREQQAVKESEKKEKEMKQGFKVKDYLTTKSSIWTVKKK